MDLYAIRRPSAWANLGELEKAGAKSARIGNEEMPDRIRWIRSYVVHEADGRIGTVCIYQARDPESIKRRPYETVPAQHFVAYIGRAGTGRPFLHGGRAPTEQMSGCKHRPSAVSCRVTPRCR